MSDALKRGTEARLQQSAIVAALVLVHEYSGKQPKTGAVLLLFGLPNRRRSRISAANETSLADNLLRNSENRKRGRMGVEGDRGMGMLPRAEDLAAM
jgi:hypothetical protein